ncbi:MAG TPA: hypothetical protein VMW63_06235 [Methanoregulaceae archaeon]|nr:hypothetical protein [Methanoregulaceae archaeon]
MNLGAKTVLSRDSIHLVEREKTVHVISEEYYYKTESYYTILSHEMRNIPVAPGSSAVLDAYVVPLCLERARLNGIPVADCIISHSCAQYPAVLYGLNYFASSSEYKMVKDGASGKETIRHITNNGKYPFCYQPLSDGENVERHVSIFGKSYSGDEDVEDLARSLYNVFRIPLVTMVCIRGDENLLLSSLAPTRYSSMSNTEKSLLREYIAQQEFL